MPLPPRPIDATLHGVTDYSVGALLATVFPKVAGIEGTRSAGQIRRAGAIHAAYSTITDYPLGIVRLLPFKAHLAIDALGAIGLAATPFVTGQWRKGRDQWVPHLGLCLFELASLALTDPARATSTATSTRSAAPTWRTPTTRSTTAAPRSPGRG